MSDASVPAGVNQASEAADPREWSWVEPVVWNERMLAALGNGVKGGKSYAFFADRGLFSLQSARVLASQSRWG